MTPNPHAAIMSLTEAILSSRRPEDDDAARLRHIGFIHFIHAGTLRGEPPTDIALSRATGLTLYEIQRHLAELVDRNIIARVNEAALPCELRTRYRFHIRSDALDAVRYGYRDRTAQN